MARPIDPNEAHRLQRRKELKYHSIVEWNDVKYTIWQDWRGPIYSTPATQHELRAAGVNNTIVMHPNYDTITYKVMERDREPTGCLSRSHASTYGMGATQF